MSGNQGTLKKFQKLQKSQEQSRKKPRNLQPLKDQQALRRSKAMRDPIRNYEEIVQIKKADAAAIAEEEQQAAANAKNKPIFELNSVILSAIYSLDTHIKSSTSNSENRGTWTEHKQFLEWLREEYKPFYIKYIQPTDDPLTPDELESLKRKCEEFINSIQPMFADGIHAYPIYMLKSILEICTILTQLCISNLQIDNAFQGYFNMISMNANIINRQIKISIDTNRCNENKENYDEIKSNHNKRNFKGDLLAWYRRVEPNSPAWIKIDIHGNILIYSSNLKKWICAHPLYHKFAYDFVKKNNVPFDEFFIIWPHTKGSASQTNDLTAPQSSEKDTLVYLQKYFDNFNINLMLQENKGETTLIGYKKLTNKNLTTDEKTNRSIEFRNNVRLFIDILQTYGDEMKEIMDFLNRLNNGELYMVIEMTGIKFKTTGMQAHEKAGDTVSEPTYIQKNMQSDSKKKNTNEVFQNKQIIQKIYNKIIEKLKSLKDDQLRNPYPNFTSKNEHPLKTRYAEEAEQKSNESSQEQLPVQPQMSVAPALNMAVNPTLATFQNQLTAATAAKAAAAPQKQLNASTTATAAKAATAAPQQQLTASTTASTAAATEATTQMLDRSNPFGVQQLHLTRMMRTTPWQLPLPLEELQQQEQQPLASRTAPAAAPSAKGRTAAVIAKNFVAAASAAPAAGVTPAAARLPRGRAGGARKYPAKKYRFASRKHSKRCKTTSHKKACRRKSHKHRRITRKR